MVNFESTQDKFDEIQVALFPEMSVMIQATEAPNVASPLIQADRCGSIASTLGTADQFQRMLMKEQIKFEMEQLARDQKIQQLQAQLFQSSTCISATSFCTNDTPVLPQSSQGSQGAALIPGASGTQIFHLCAVGIFILMQFENSDLNSLKSTILGSFILLK